MKNLKLIIAALLFSGSLFAVSPASAKDEPKPDPGKGVNLPINKQAWFLLVAGAGIGCVVILKKNNSGKKAAVQTIN